MSSPTLCGLETGEQLGNLEYLIDDSALDAHRSLAGEYASYANLLADDCRSILAARCDAREITTIWRGFQFLRPPALGRRIQVGGWLKDAGESGGMPLARVSTFAVDEIGTEILRSEAAFLIGSRPGNEPKPVRIYRPAAGAYGESLAGGSVGITAMLGSWVLPNAERFDAYRRASDSLSGLPWRRDGNGMTQLVAGWLEGVISREWGDDFRWGGQLSLAYHLTAKPGDTIHAWATIIGDNRDRYGSRRIASVISVTDHSGSVVASGEASVTMPSPRLL